MSDLTEARSGKQYNIRHKETPSPLSLVEQAKADSLAFLEKQLEIPPPPQLLLSTLVNIQTIRLQAQGIYFPRVTLGQNDNYPGWHTKIGTDYYDWLKAGQISKASPELSGIWAIVDTSLRSDYAPTRQLKKRWEAIPSGTTQRPNDPEPHNAVERIIREARSKGEIETRDYWGPILPYLPTTSRFGVSTDEQDDVVFPRLAEKLGLTEVVRSGKATIERPTLAQFNYLGNLTGFSHLAQYGTSETVQDVYKGILDPKDQEAHKHPRAITTGNTIRGGVSQVDYLLTDDHADAVSFRFVIAFLQPN